MNTEIQVKEIKVGVKRYVATCQQHPTWRPGSHYDRRLAEWDADSHRSSWQHDGIDYAALPATLAATLAEVHSPELRIRLARAAKHWKEETQP